ncbi:MAG: D-aminoacyl-tRNA deacylase [archaeon]
MQIAVIVSSQDPAGLNIRERLVESLVEPGPGAEGEFEGSPVYRISENALLYTTNTDSIFCEHIDQRITADLIIFATRHKSEAGIPSLSVHAPGNWAAAEYGGEDRKLCVAPALYLRTALLKLIEKGAGTGYDVVQECTHHGPYVEKPCMFIEIGSSERQWSDPKAGRIIADTIAELVSCPPEGAEVAFGIGGLHTTPNFRKVMLKEKIAFGHVCPKYMLEHLSREMIEQALVRSTEPAEIVILDWKGLKTEKARIVQLLELMKIKNKKTKDC